MTHLNLSDIVFIEVENHKSLIHSLETTWEVRKSLKEFEGMLGADFLRVHRSYIVNLTKIKKIREHMTDLTKSNFRIIPRPL